MEAHQPMQSKEVSAEKKLHFAEEEKKQKEDKGVESITPIKLEQSARSVNDESVNARSALKPQSRSNSSFGRRLSMHGEALRVHVDPTPQIVEAYCSPLDENVHDDKEMEHVRRGVVANWLADIGAKDNKFHSLLLELATHILIRRPADPQQFLVDHFYSHELPLLQVVPNGRPFNEQQEQEYQMHHHQKIEKAQIQSEGNTTLLSHPICKRDEGYDHKTENRIDDDDDDDDDVNTKEIKPRDSADVDHNQLDTLTIDGESNQDIESKEQEQEVLLKHNMQENSHQMMERKQKGKFTQTASDKQSHQKEEKRSGETKNVESCTTELSSSPSPLAMDKESCPVIEQLVNAIPVGPSKVAAYRLAEMLLNLKPDDPEHYLWTKLESRVFSDDAAMGNALASTLDDFPSISADDRTQASLLREVAFDSAGYSVAANMISLLFTRKPDDPVTYLYYHFNGKIHTSEAQSIRSSSRRDATCDSASCTSRSCVDESDYATTTTTTTTTTTVNNNDSSNIYEETNESSVDSNNSDIIENYNEHYHKHGSAEVLPNEYKGSNSFNEQLLRKRESINRSKRAKSCTSYPSSDAKCTSKEKTLNESSHTRRNTNVTLHRGGSFGSLAESLLHHNNNDVTHHHKHQDVPDSCLYEHDFISSEQAQQEEQPYELKEQEEEEELKERPVKQLQRKVLRLAHSTGDLRRTSYSTLDDNELDRHRKGSEVYYGTHTGKRKHQKKHKASVELPIVTNYNNRNNNGNSHTFTLENSNRVVETNKNNNNNVLCTLKECHEKHGKHMKSSNAADDSRRKYSSNSTMTNKWDANAKGTTSSLKSHVSFPSSSSEAFITNTNTSLSSCLSKNDEKDDDVVVHNLDNNIDTNNHDNHITDAVKTINSNDVKTENAKIEKDVHLPVSTIKEKAQKQTSHSSSATFPTTSSRHVMINTDTSTTSSSSSSSSEEYTSSPVRFVEPTFLNASQSMLVSLQKQHSHRNKPHTFMPRGKNHNKRNLINQKSNNTLTTRIDNYDWNLLRNRYEVWIACLQHELDTLKATCAYRERMMSIDESEANKQECDKIHNMCTETEQHLHYLQDRADELNKRYPAQVCTTTTSTKATTKISSTIAPDEDKRITEQNTEGALHSDGASVAMTQQMRRNSQQYPTELDIVCKQMELLEMQWLRANAQKVQLQRDSTTL